MEVLAAGRGSVKLGVIGCVGPTRPFVWRTGVYRWGNCRRRGRWRRVCRSQVRRVSPSSGIRTPPPVCSTRRSNPPLASQLQPLPRSSLAAQLRHQLLNGRRATPVEHGGAPLIAISGCGAITAAKILGGDRRVDWLRSKTGLCPSQRHLAMPVWSAGPTSSISAEPNQKSPTQRRPATDCAHPSALARTSQTVM